MNEPYEGIEQESLPVTYRESKLVTRRDVDNMKFLGKLALSISLFTALGLGGFVYHLYNLFMISHLWLGSSCQQQRQTVMPPPVTFMVSDTMPDSITTFVIYTTGGTIPTPITGTLSSGWIPFNSVPTWTDLGVDVLELVAPLFAEVYHQPSPKHNPYGYCRYAGQNM